MPEERRLIVRTVSGKTGATGAAGAGAGVGLAPLIIWILGLFGVDMPPEVAAVAGGLLAAVTSTVIAWLVPAKTGKYVDTEPWIVDVDTPFEDYDPNESVEDFHDPETDVEEDPANEDAGVAGEHVAGARPVGGDA